MTHDTRTYGRAITTAEAKSWTAGGPAPLLDHLHRALVDLLSDHPAKTADKAFAALVADKNIGGLRTLSFVPAAKLARLSSRVKAAGRFVSLSDEESALYPAGIPGFPNVLTRKEFNAAWKEARGG